MFALLGLGLPELLVVLAIVLVFFGASRLPKLTRSLGESAKEFKDAYSGAEGEKSLRDIAKEASASVREVRDSVQEFKQDITAPLVSDNKPNSNEE